MIRLLHLESWHSLGQDFGGKVPGIVFVIVCWETCWTELHHCSEHGNFTSFMGCSFKKTHTKRDSSANHEAANPLEDFECDEMQTFVPAGLQVSFTDLLVFSPHQNHRPEF